MRCKMNRMLATAVMVALPFLAGAQLLKGTVEKGFGELQVAISQDGDILSTEYLPVEVGEDGSFSFDKELEKPFNDVTLYVNGGGGEMYVGGAHLEKGKTLEVAIRKGEDGSVVFDFKGDNKALSEFWTAFEQAYDLMRYMPMDPSAALSYGEYRKLLSEEDARVKALLPSIPDEELREYYARLADGTYKHLVLRLIQNETYGKEKKASDYPEYVEILGEVDVNDEIDMRSELVFSKIYSLIDPALVADGGMSTEYFLAFMKVVDEQVANPVVRKALARDCAYSYFTFGEGGDCMKFWEAYKAFAKEYPEVIAQYQPQVDARLKTAKGTPAPDIMLSAPDGKTCQLSDLFGKFLYIDVWATWCGPCCAEIPNLEKVAAHFKGNDKVQVMSISVDADQEAWKAKLEKDQPEWAQYILSREDAATFSKDWGISGIPRFIMIDKDGKIFNADAPRPSNEKIIETIEEQLK